MINAKHSPRRGDLSSPQAIYAKGILFLIVGFLAGGLLLAEHFSWQRLALLAICVWAFSRAYYFAFYVIEHYVDSGFRYSGLTDFAKYCLKSRTGKRDMTPPEDTVQELNGREPSKEKNAVDR